MSAISSSSARVAFIGLGVMGYHMAGHLQRAGHRVTVFNRNPEKSQAWVAEFGGVRADTPALAAANADVVMLCVGRDEDVREVTFGEHGVAQSLRANSIVIDHTTTSAELPRELAVRFAEKSIAFLDAPISGGQIGAQRGQLTIMVGGDKAALTRAESLLKCYGRCVEHLGESGAGQLAKMANQICIAGLVQGLAEAIHFARNADLDIETLINVISQGAAQSWQMQNRYKTMMAGEYNHGFAVDWMRKDLAYTLDEARRNGSSLPVTALVDQFYGEVQMLGGGRWDTSSLLARLEAHRNKPQAHNDKK
ncbi:MAG: NAD(P)-dependent oxidoreductase [Spongiibacteraceae bacterium]